MVRETTVKDPTGCSQSITLLSDSDKHLAAGTAVQGDECMRYETPWIILPRKEEGAIRGALGANGIPKKEGGGAHISTVYYRPLPDSPDGILASFSALVDG